VFLIFNLCWDGPFVKILTNCCFVFCFHGGPRMEGKRGTDEKSAITVFSDMTLYVPTCQRNLLPPSEL
jgi:hypothetical protein